jgi:hypothetical protein
MLLDLKSIYPYSLVLLSVLLTVLPLCSRMIVKVCISTISGKYCEVQVVLYPIACILYIWAMGWEPILLGSLMLSVEDLLLFWVCEWFCTFLYSLRFFTSQSILPVNLVSPPFTWVLSCSSCAFGLTSWIKHSFWLSRNLGGFCIGLLNGGLIICMWWLNCVLLFMKHTVFCSWKLNVEHCHMIIRSMIFLYHCCVTFKVLWR